MRRWRILKCDAKGDPVEWRLKPWTIVRATRGNSEAFGLWRDYKGKPEVWADDLSDAQQFARMYEDND